MWVALQRAKGIGLRAWSRELDLKNFGLWISDFEFCNCKTQRAWSQSLTRTPIRRALTPCLPVCREAAPRRESRRSSHQPVDVAFRSRNLHLPGRRLDSAAPRTVP